MSENGDYISREAFKAEILRLSTHYLNEWDTLGVLAAADRIPAADVRPVVRGKWIRHTDTSFGPKLNDCIECNCCGIWFSTENMIRRSFCPNCGAWMEEN